MREEATEALKESHLKCLKPQKQKLNGAGGASQFAVLRHTIFWSLTIILTSFNFVIND